MTPIVAGAIAAVNGEAFVSRFLRNEDVPLWLLIWGSAGQVLFTGRFIYQYFYSRRHGGESVLPAAFWWLSLTGSLIIVSYGVWRLDPVLIIGQSFGLTAYIRNLIIGKRTNKET